MSERSNMEAPLSTTVRGFYKGYSILFTMRDPDADAKPLLEKAMMAVDFMEAQGFKPSWKDDTSYTAGSNTAGSKRSPTKSKSSSATTTVPLNDPCPECGGKVFFRAGTSSKGKEYMGSFCSKCDWVDWHNDTDLPDEVRREQEDEIIDNSDIPF